MQEWLRIKKSDLVSDITLVAYYIYVHIYIHKIDETEEINLHRQPAEHIKNVM